MTEDDVRTPRTADAVVVVPGIMGSELVDANGQVVWGLHPRSLGKAWVTRQVNELHVTESELNGTPRLWATQLLRVPAYLPVLRGLEPYNGLLNRLREHAVLDTRAVLEFAYDWRLSIEHNAAALVSACEQHLAAWRQIVAAERYANPEDVRLVLVAHSMGGLISRYACEVLELGQEVRRVMTLGTPYFGSMNALQMMDRGAGSPLPRRAARALALTCPGVYDLLPRYRCIQDAQGPERPIDSRDDRRLGDERPVAATPGLRALQTSDITALEGDASLSVAAQRRWDRLGLRAGSSTTYHLNALVGVQQPTLQSARLEGGAWTFERSLEGVDWAGDSTVYRQAAAPLDLEAFALPQKHGALAQTPEALSFVVDKIIGGDTRPPLGTRPLGVDVDEEVEAGSPVIVRVHAADGSPVGLTVHSTNLTYNRRTTWERPVRDEAGDNARFTRILEPGLHRIDVKAGGFAAVRDHILVLEN